MPPSTPVRTAARRLPRDHRVAAIMQTARAVLRERGSEQFLTSEVAERCGVSEGTIYKYFKSKRDLLTQVVEEWFEEFLSEEQPSNAEQPIHERLFRAIWRNLSRVRREPALTRFVLVDLRADPNFRQMPIYQQNRRFVKSVMDVIEDGIKRGEVRDNISLTLIRDMIFGAIEHQTWAFLRGEGDFSVDDCAAGITDVVVKGIGIVSPVESEGRLEETIKRLEAVTTALVARSER